MDLSQPVADLMTANPITVDIGASLTDAWTEMLNGGFRHLPVVEKGRLMGMLSAADVMRSLGHQDDQLQDTGVVLDNGKVRELMTEDVVAVTLGTTLEDAIRLLANGKFHSLPVLSGGKLVGIFTTTDILLALLDKP